MIRAGKLTQHLWREQSFVRRYDAIQGDREREREREKAIYIYIYGERERVLWNWDAKRTNLTQPTKAMSCLVLPCLVDLIFSLSACDQPSGIEARVFWPGVCKGAEFSSLAPKSLSFDLPPPIVFFFPAGKGNLRRLSSFATTLFCRR